MNGPETGEWPPPYIALPFRVAWWLSSATTAPMLCDREHLDSFARQ